jgi:hypothetical protein
MGDKAESLLKGRVRVVKYGIPGANLNAHPAPCKSHADLRLYSAWRPIIDVVEDCPLAVCDGTSVPLASCVTADFVRKQYVGESLHPLPYGNYRWYYLDKQTKHELLLLKMYDSDEAVSARCMCRMTTILGQTNAKDVCRVPSCCLRNTESHPQREAEGKH